MKRAHVLLALAVMVIWGVNFVVLKIALETFPPLLLLALRFTLAALPALIVPRPKVAPWRIVVIGATMFGGQFGLTFLALAQGVPAGLTAVVLQTQVLFTIALAALVFREQLAARQIAGIAAACAGLGIVALTLGHDAPLFGIGLVALAGLSWACGNIVTRRAGSANMFSLVIWASLVPPLPAYVLSLWFEGSARIAHALVPLSASGVAALAFIVVFSTIGAFGAWSFLLRRYSAGVVTPFALLVPPIGMLSSALVFHEPFPPVRLAAVALILLGLVFVVAPKRRSVVGLQRAA